MAVTMRAKNVFVIAKILMKSSVTEIFSANVG